MQPPLQFHFQPAIASAYALAMGAAGGQSNTAIFYENLAPLLREFISFVKCVRVRISFYVNQLDNLISLMMQHYVGSAFIHRTLVRFKINCCK
jgi:hypothetical protein